MQATRLEMEALQVTAREQGGIEDFTVEQLVREADGMESGGSSH